MSYENIAQVYARLVKRGKRTLESIKNPIIRERVREIVNANK
mgnify:CR=1 FL=1